MGLTTASVRTPSFRTSRPLSHVKRIHATLKAGMPMQAEVIIQGGLSQVEKFTHIHIHTYTYIHYTSIHLYINTYTYTYIYIYTSIHIYIYTNPKIHPSIFLVQAWPLRACAAAVSPTSWSSKAKIPRHLGWNGRPGPRTMTLRPRGRTTAWNTSSI